MDHENCGQTLRLFALRQIAHSTLLQGVVISQDRKGPIAARIMLVPKGSHHWDDAQSRLTDTQLIEHMIIKGSDPYDDDPDFIPEVMRNLTGVLPGGNPESLFALISNTTFTVVQSDKEQMDKRQQELLSLEQEYREICTANEVDFRESMISALRAHIRRGRGA